MLLFRFFVFGEKKREREKERKKAREASYVRACGPIKRETIYFMSSNIENLKSFDPFAEADVDDAAAKQNFIHIRIQQRNGRKTLTTIQGLPAELSFKRILQTFKKDFCCNGTIVDDPELGQVIQLQGDQRKNVADFLVNEGICTKSKVKVHGF